MILAALLLQAAAVPAEPLLKPIDTAVAITTFKTLCWTSFRDPDAFHAAIVTAPLSLAAVPSRQCRLRVALAGAADQLSLSGRVAAALKLSTGRTRTNPAGAETAWDVKAADGRIVRLLVATRNAARGGTELRLSALLLAAR